MCSELFEALLEAGAGSSDADYATDSLLSDYESEEIYVDSLIYELRDRIISALHDDGISYDEIDSDWILHVCKDAVTAVIGS